MHVITFRLISINITLTVIRTFWANSRRTKRSCCWL